ncbi:hypothetical protein QVO10_18295 [Bacteroides gallinaceum]|uniref:Uncharacterized protein n=1 Tax=Bacteroides gallinaceum TaxID=1462571 RepID=A0ABT7XB57_9BACE|nr:hypothetical protein [Bacteroides gallinaceum]MDN0051289.1 hypothetical protein [Bacteroides gallinaceum]
MENNKERKVYEYAKDYSNRDLMKEHGKEVGKTLLEAAMNLVGIWLNSKGAKK